MSRLFIFLVFLLAPIVVLVLLTQGYAEDPTIGASETYEEVILRNEFDSVDFTVKDIGVSLRELSIRMSDMEFTLEEYNNIFFEQYKTLLGSIEDSENQKQLSDDIYEQRITNALGEPIDFYLDNKMEIKIFELKELGYRGYIAKVKMYDPRVFEVVLGQDKLGGLETTSEAAERKNAVLAINGGGFGQGVYQGEMVSTMIGGTVIEGKLVNQFIRKDNEDLFFVGIQINGDLVGNIPDTAEDIMNLNPYQGVSFIPILIQHGEKKELPTAWANTNHPRTIIGQYANDDLIMIVVDGRQNDWSSGISLERLQDKLLELGVKDAYNLDGGGSTAMYFKGQLLNKPSDGSERPVANNIILKQ